MEKTSPRVYTPAEVADILSITEYTVIKWLREGKLKGIKIGRLWRITEDGLNKFLAEEGE